MRKYIKILISILLFFIFFQTTTAQDKFKFSKSNLFLGGDIGMSFGDYTFVQISPVAYYRFSESLYGGLGLEFTFYKEKFDGRVLYEGTSWTPRILVDYFLLENVFIRGEYQQIYYKDTYSSISLLPEAWATQRRILAGAGYRSMISENFYTFVLLLFDVESRDIEFGINPFLQLGFAVGL